jgi:ribosomal protein S17E
MMKNKFILVLLIAVLSLHIFTCDTFENNKKVFAANDNVISKEVMKDKMKGGWIGELWANFTGLPTEFHFTTTPNPADSVEWILSDVYVTDDDTSLEYTFLHMMEVYGANTITYNDMPKEWIYHFQDYIWEDNYYARELMKRVRERYNSEICKDLKQNKIGCAEIIDFTYDALNDILSK